MPGSGLGPLGQGIWGILGTQRGLKGKHRPVCTWLLGPTDWPEEGQRQASTAHGSEQGPLLDTVHFGDAGCEAHLVPAARKRPRGVFPRTACQDKQRPV